MAIVHGYIILCPRNMIEIKFNQCENDISWLGSLK